MKKKTLVTYVLAFTIMGVGVFFFCLEAFGKIKLGGWSPLIIVIATGISIWGSLLHMDDITELKEVEG